MPAGNASTMYPAHPGDVSPAAVMSASPSGAALSDRDASLPDAFHLSHAQDEADKMRNRRERPGDRI